MLRRIHASITMEAQRDGLQPGSLSGRHGTAVYIYSKTFDGCMLGRSMDKCDQFSMCRQ
jgi:hypothetical protein